NAVIFDVQTNLGVVADFRLQIWIRREVEEIAGMKTGNERFGHRRRAVAFRISVVLPQAMSVAKWFSMSWPFCRGIWCFGGLPTNVIFCPREQRGMQARTRTIW